MEWTHDLHGGGRTTTPRTGVACAGGSAVTGGLVRLESEDRWPAEITTAHVGMRARLRRSDPGGRRCGGEIRAEGGTCVNEVPGRAAPALSLPDIQRAVETVLPDGVALPATELSGYRGYPIIQWSEGTRSRLKHGPEPMLDRPTLSLWESWPCGVDHQPPAAPLCIVGFASTATWPHAVRAAAELRGFGDTFVVTAKKPNTLRLTEADVACVGVVHVTDTDAQLLVRGHRVPAENHRRTVGTRYWEERLFAHALTTGATAFLPERHRSIFPAISSAPTRRRRPRR